MLDQFAIGRFARALPATTAALTFMLLIAAVVVIQAIAGNIEADVGSGLLLLLVLFSLFVVLGLIMDGSVNARAKTHWENVLLASATDVERIASRYFTDHGWTAQRDDPDFKVFVRRTRLNILLLLLLALLGVFPAVLYLAFWSLSRREVMTITITTVLRGARIELIGPSGAMDGFYRATELELPRPHFDRVRSGT